MRRLLAIAGLALLSGCFNFYARPKKARWACSPYENTVEAAKTLAKPFKAPVGPEGDIEKAMVIVCYPVLVIDFPLDAAVDTVFLPWDLWWRWIDGARK